MKKKICFFAIGFFLLFFGNNVALKNQAETIEKQIESAIYRREDFFGVSAIVPNPTAVVYQNLLKISDSNEPIIFAKLAEVTEKLEKFEEAENYFIKAKNLDNLAEFYQRRGNFIKKAEVLEQIFNQTKRLDIFEQLIQFSKLHEISQYQKPEYFQQIADKYEDVFPIIEKLIEKLIEEKQTEKAFVIIRQFKSKFPEKMLEKEVSLLAAKEAETVYFQSFNPFWSDVVAKNFYRFLDENDRFRIYGSELKSKITIVTRQLEIIDSVLSGTTRTAHS
ncbi:MAG: hypothetical protein MUC29_07875 [Pyrinomonadaceae bacterium]|nr:hypothetical protein [Pyrinomonadaceae bacterium]